MKPFAAHVLVSGRVQGVFFRQSTQARARDLGLGGFVRNLPDGRVEALFVGEEAAVEAAIAYVGQGPPAAAVKEVVVNRHPEIGSEGPAGGFQVR